MARQERPPFIADQGMRLLQETGDPWRYLRAEYFHQQRLKEPGAREAPGERDPWKPVDRRQVAFDRVPGCDLRRLVITTYAGVGKTTTIAWLHAVLNRPGSLRTAFLVNVPQLPTGPARDSPTDLVLDLLATTLSKAPGNRRSGFDERRRAVDRLLEQGRLTLLLDGLDQADAHDPRVCETLAFILEDAAWRDCRIVIASRPYALELNRETLFEGTGPWQFLQLDELTEAQQRLYLGDRRFEVVPEDAREILAVPRVLYYLRHMEEPDLARVHTASDVYWYATSKLLTDGMKAKAAARLDPDDARLLLAAIAFEMLTAWITPDAVHEGEMGRFKSTLAKRCAAYRRGCTLRWCRDKLKRLAAMNEFLSHGLLEAGCPQQVQWRNSSLQEFFAGLWLSRYCTEAEKSRLDGAIYLAHEPASRRYYWMWRFAAEMPAEGRDTTRWVEAMSRVYQPGDGTAQGTTRSTEIIYRSAETVRAFSAAQGENSPRAQELRSAFQSRCVLPYQCELEQEILDGRRDNGTPSGEPKPSHIMREFLAVRAGPEKHRFGFRRIPPRGKGPFPFTMGSPQDEAIREEDEGPYETAIEKPYFLACTPTTNEQYELFDPSHRERAWPARLAGPDDPRQCPVVEVSFYDAWAFCLWLGAGYRLPTEKEWEYACRAGTTSPWCFGDDTRRLVKYAWYRENSGGVTHPVGLLESNAWGLCDVHGNVHEWCDTWYDEELATSDSPTYRGFARVWRSGSWDSRAWSSRSASRDANHPDFRGHGLGFRVARTE